MSARLWLALALFACNEPPQSADLPSESAAAASSAVVEEEQSEIVGLVVPLVDEEISALAPGQLTELLVGLGDEVEPGQPLARLSSPDLAHNLARARARAKSAASEERAASVRAEAAAAESESLTGLSGAVSRRDQEQALVLAKERAEDASALKAKAAEALAEVALLEVQSGALTLTARTAGRVLAIYKRLGEHVEEGHAVARVASEAQIVRFAAPSAVSLRPGQAVEIVARGGRVSASVARVAPSVDSAGMILAETDELREPLQLGEICRLRLSGSP